MEHATLAELLTIYSEREPFVIEHRLGDAALIIFDDVFISLVLLAFSTNCLNQMGETELELFNNFIDYEDGTFSDVNVIALDVWLANLANSVENPKIEGCSANG